MGRTLTTTGGKPPAPIDAFNIMREMRGIFEPCAPRRSAATVERLKSQVAAGLRPAEASMIGKEVTMLLSSFPASNAPDPRTYAAMMVQRIAAKRPSMIALASTCIKIVEEMKWPPSIAEVLTLLEAEDEAWPHRASLLQSLTVDGDEIPW